MTVREEELVDLSTSKNRQTIPSMMKRSPTLKLQRAPEIIVRPMISTDHGSSQIEPTMLYAIGYEDGDRLRAALRFDGVMPPRPLTAGGSTFGKARHFDQFGRVTGELWLDGERIAIDCLAMRDRTWGRRPEDRPPPCPEDAARPAQHDEGRPARDGGGLAGAASDLGRDVRGGSGGGLEGLQLVAQRGACR